MEGSRGGRRWRRSAAFIAITLVFGMVSFFAGAGSSNAVASQSLGSQWNAEDGVVDTTGVADIPDASGHADATNYNEGASEDTVCPAVQAGTAANKDDVDHVYFGVQATATTVFTYMGWHRIATNGTTTIDFELNHSGVPKSNCNGYNPARQAGDILVTYDFQGSGPFTIDISFSRWVGTADAGTWVPATPPLSGTAHKESISADGAFGELVIDLDAAGVLTATRCESFSGFFVKTRSSSQNFSNTIKDFVPPQKATVSNCGAISIHKQDDAEAALQGVQFDLYTDVNNAPGVAVTPAVSCTTDASGDCTMSDIEVGTYWVVEHAAPSGHTGADPQKAVVTASATVSLTFENPRKPASITILKVDDTQAENPLSGAQFSLYSGGNPVSGKTCTTGSDGTCSITNILPPGTYTVKETVTPAGYDTAADQTVDLELDETAPLKFVDPLKGIGVSLVKKVNGVHSTEADPLLVESGSTVTYTVTIENTGDVPLTISALSDTLNADLPDDCEQGIGSTLDVGEDFTCTYQSAVTEDAHNVASVTGTDVLNRTTSDSDEVFVTPINPGIALSKTGPSAAHVGEKVAYTFTVGNLGDTPLSNVTLTDDRCTDDPVISSKSGGNDDDVLDLDETWTYTCEYTVVEADGASVVNNAEVAGTDPLETTVKATDDYTFPVLHPSITIDKTANPTSITDSGPVTYTYVVTNNGDTTLFDIAVTDDVLGAIGSIASLGAGESQTLTKTVTVTTSTKATNVGTATGADVLGFKVSDTDDATISVVLGVVIERPKPAPVTLPKTGAMLLRETWWALLLIGLGGLLVATTRRRSRRLN